MATPHRGPETGERCRSIHWAFSRDRDRVRSGPRPLGPLAQRRHASADAAEDQYSCGERERGDQERGAPADDAVHHRGPQAGGGVLLPGGGQAYGPLRLRDGGFGAAAADARAAVPEPRRVRSHHAGNERRRSRAGTQGGKRLAAPVTGQAESTPEVGGPLAEAGAAIESAYARFVRPLVPPDQPLWDAHAHLGRDDDRARLQTGALLAEMRDYGVAKAFVVPFAAPEPDGYRELNNRIIEECAGSEGALVPFCRSQPGEGFAAELGRALDCG